MTDEEAKELFKEQQRQVVEGINLVNGVKIRLVSKEDIEDLKSGFFPLPTNLRERISPNTTVLAKNIEVKENHDFELDKTMRNVVLALRLLKEGYFYGNYVCYILLPEKRSRILDSLSWDEQPRERRLGFGYALNFDEIPELKKLLEKLQALDFSKRKNLHLACKRFQRTYEESDSEDQLIDLIIAFEALFLKGEKRMSWRGQTIAIACSTLLGKNEEEREEIRSFLTKAYELRNCIVHGSEYKKPYVKKEFEISDFVSEIEDYLRESIKKLLD